jgi:hypothetical protein
MSADRCLDRVIGFLQFGSDTIVAHFAKSWMRPAVIADFVALADRALQNFRVLRGVLANHKKGRMDVMRSQYIK